MSRGRPQGQKRPLHQKLPIEDDQEKLTAFVRTHGIDRILVALGYIQPEIERVEVTAINLDPTFQLRHYPAPSCIQPLSSSRQL
jgi:hypothetical protein